MLSEPNINHAVVKLKCVYIKLNKWNGMPSRVTKIGVYNG